MTMTELIGPNLKRLHENLVSATMDLTHEQLHWRPSEGCNHIAFSLWHYVRTEDNLVRFVLQERRAPVWLEQGWNERFGLDRVAQGTGMSPEDASAIRLSSAEEFLPYMRAVWQSTEEYLSSVSDNDMQKVFTVKPFGERPVVQVLTENLLTHGFSHLGEMWALRGLQGMKGSPI
jgi:hypothetical protein